LSSGTFVIIGFNGDFDLSDLNFERSGSLVVF